MKKIYYYKLLGLIAIALTFNVCADISYKHRFHNETDETISVNVFYHGLSKKKTEHYLVLEEGKQAVVYPGVRILKRIEVYNHRGDKVIVYGKGIIGNKNFSITSKQDFNAKNWTRYSINEK